MHSQFTLFSGFWVRLCNVRRRRATILLQATVRGWVVRRQPNCLLRLSRVRYGIDVHVILPSILRIKYL